MAVAFSGFSPCWVGRHYGTSRRETEMRMSCRSLILLLALVLPAGRAFSQGAQSGAISGSVTDPTGAVIGNATVTVVNDATQNVERTVTTTGDGLFSATLLPPGDYTVSVKASGFKAFTEKVTVLL